MQHLEHVMCGVVTCNALRVHATSNHATAMNIIIMCLHGKPRPILPIQLYSYNGASRFGIKLRRPTLELDVF